MFVRLDHVAVRIENVDHGTMCAAELLTEFVELQKRIHEYAAALLANS